MHLSIRRWMLCDPFVVSHPVSFHRCLFHIDTLLFPQFHQVFLPDLVHNTYLDHAILHNVHVIIKNDVGKVIRIVASKSTDCFSDEASLIVMLVVVVLISIIAINKTLASTTPELEFSIEWALLMSSLAR